MILNHLDGHDGAAIERRAAASGRTPATNNGGGCGTEQKSYRCSRSVRQSSILLYSPEFKAIVKCLLLMALHDHHQQPRHPEAPWHLLPFELLYKIIAIMQPGGQPSSDSRGTPCCSDFSSTSPL